MHVNGPSFAHGAHALGGPHRISQPAGPASSNHSTQIADELEISDAGQYLSEIKQTPDIRADRVRAIQAEIASGAYETQDKLDLALERLLDEIS